MGKRHVVEGEMSVVFTERGSRVLTNVGVRFDDRAGEMWPQRIPDLYAGEPVIVAVRFSKPSGRVIASASRGHAEWNDVHSVTAVSEEAGIGKLWARMKIEALSDAGDANTDEITGIALEHHL